MKKSPIGILAARWRIALVALAISTAIHAQAAPQFADPIADVERVFQLLDRRLALMPEVAAWKWREQQPIFDAAREHAVLNQAVRDAQALGLYGDVQRFFDVQFRMARAVQTQHFELWRSRSMAPPRGRNLTTELRPLLDAIGRELLVAVYLASAELPQALKDTHLTPLRKHPSIDDALLSELRAALLGLQMSAAPSLGAIQRVGVVRIGTTGDYAPFSEASNDTLRGFDVDLAQALAKSWRVRVQFVRTTWPSLMADLQQRRFDMAMSGISVTPERAAVADFSAAYHVDGKTPIARCANADRFNSLEKIDLPGVRVIVNPGGTNERFVREHIKRANIVVHADNRTIFDELLAGRADAMITDGIEVQLQTLRHTELCGTSQALLTNSPKAILLPKESPLKAEVDAWLAPRIQNGELRRELQQAVLKAADR